MLKDCNNCRYINITEIEQRKINEGNRINHFCKKYKKRVLHLGHPYHIKPCEECIADEFDKDVHDEIHEIALEEAFKYGKY